MSPEPLDQLGLEAPTERSGIGSDELPIEALSDGPLHPITPDARASVAT